MLESTVLDHSSIQSFSKLSDCSGSFKKYYLTLNFSHIFQSEINLLLTDSPVIAPIKV